MHGSHSHACKRVVIPPVRVVAAAILYAADVLVVVLYRFRVVSYKT